MKNQPFYGKVRLSLSKKTISNLNVNELNQMVAGHGTGGNCNVPQKTKACTNNQKTCKATCV
jgi:hypothetical protein